MKAQMSRAVRWIIKNDGIRALVAGLVLLFVAMYMRYEYNDEPVLSFAIFSVVLLTFILQIISTAITRVAMNVIEDTAKLESNFSRLVQQYDCSMIEYDNLEAEDANRIILHKKKNGESSFRFPIILDCDFSNANISITDSDWMYTPPEIVMSHYDKLLSAHISSNVYNQLMIRVDSWRKVRNKFIINTSRTTYYNSLVTNRVMDYPWGEGLTLRDFLFYGPFVPALKDSLLSNHLGFNGFIETVDGFIPFVKRNRIVSIGKATYANSIGASLKAKYSLDGNEILTESGLCRGIIREIEDELKIPSDQIIDFNLKGNLIAAYRDLVEGGKPQLLFYAKTRFSRDVLEANFKAGIKKKRLNILLSTDKIEKELEDGKRLLWIHKDELSSLAIAPDGIVYNKKFYPMMPSASAAIILLLRFFMDKKEISL